MISSNNIDNMIAKIIRDTRVTDSSYLADMFEWIPEGMRMLRTGVEMKITPYKVPISNYVGKLPCGLIDLIAVEYHGQRLRYYTGIRQGANQSVSPIFVETSAFAVPTTEAMPSGNVLDITYVMGLDTVPNEGYQVYMDYITTTFQTGEVTVYIKEAPLDSKGLPLIPDHADYKEALYWFVRSKMIQSGYSDPVYQHDDRIAFERFEMYAARAISDITYPSVDQKEAQLAMGVRFIPPSDYFSSFFNTVEHEPTYGRSGAETASNSAFGAVPPLGSSINPD